MFSFLYHIVQIELLLSVIGTYITRLLIYCIFLILIFDELHYIELNKSILLSKLSSCKL